MDVTCSTHERITIYNLLKNLKGRENFGDQFVDGKIILKWILEK